MKEQNQPENLKEWLNWYQVATLEELELVLSREIQNDIEEHLRATKETTDTNQQIYVIEKERVEFEHLEVKASSEEEALDLARQREFRADTVEFSEPQILEVREVEAQ